MQLTDYSSSAHHGTTVTNPIHMSWTREGAPGSKEGNGKNFIQKKPLSLTVIYTKSTTIYYYQ
jgi:hypothetical protein